MSEFFSTSSIDANEGCAGGTVINLSERLVDEAPAVQITEAMRSAMARHPAFQHRQHLLPDATTVEHDATNMIPLRRENAS